MLKIKPGVKLAGLSPEMSLAVSVAEPIYASQGRDLRITSALDGKHKHASKHYTGHALDFGTKEETTGAQYHDELKGWIAAQLISALGNEFDVVLEADHIHVEFDPK